MEDREDSAAGPSQRTYLAESSAEMSAERSRWLVTQTNTMYSCRLTGSVVLGGY